MAESGYKRRLGDRKEGRALRSISPITKFIPYMSRTASESLGQFSGTLDITAAENYIAAKRSEGLRGISIMHVFIAAYVRAVALHPALNRYVSGQKLFSRHTIDVVLSAKTDQTSDASTTIVKIELDPSDTVYDVYEKVNGTIDAILADDGMGGVQGMASAFQKFPGGILKFVMSFLRFLDYFGWLPRGLNYASPNHGSFALTDLGIAGSNPMYMPISNFGSIPVSGSLGVKRDSIAYDKSGNPMNVRTMDFAATIDTRCIEPFYFATAFKGISYFMRNPHLLEVRPRKVEEDVF